MDWFDKIKIAILDIFFPKFCLGCGKEGTYLCKDCQSCLEISENIFCLCKKPKMIPLLESSEILGKCNACRSKNLDGLFFPLSYKHNLVKEIIHQLKYEPFVKDLAKTLTELIIAHFFLLDNKKVWENKILVPIPLERKKLKWRGFNQAEEIAKELANKLGIPLLTECLKKIKITLPQAELSEKERKGNIKGAFLARNTNLIKNKKVLLVDDVYTTGATMEEAAKVLKEAGAKEVWGVVVAREPLID